jgi:hypothetical protein
MVQQAAGNAGTYACARGRPQASVAGRSKRDGVMDRAVGAGAQH